jgi:hypothetical protein
MNDVLDFAMNGHGGLDRWREFTAISAHLSPDPPVHFVVCG